MLLLMVFQLETQSASLYLYGGSITVVFNDSIPQVLTNTLVATTFLSHASLNLAPSNVSLSLEDSTCSSSSANNNTIVITLSINAYNSLVQHLVTTKDASTSKIEMFLNGIATELSYFCLLSPSERNHFQFIDNHDIQILAQRAAVMSYVEPLALST